MNEALYNNVEADIAKAADCLLQKWPGGKKSSGVLQQETKADGSLVTEADFASNEIIVSSIQKHFPDDAILSEELPPPTDLVDRERVWIIDPLDGTSHFAQGRDDFSILVGLSLSGSMQYGVMHFPAQKQVVIGWKGKETLVNGVATNPSSSDSIGKNRLYTRNFTLADEDKPLDLGRPMDSGMALLSVANGSLDGIVMKMTTHKVWDIAAPVVALQGAGAKVTDENGKELDFRTGEVNFQYFVASNGRVHNQLLEVIERSC